MSTAIHVKGASETLKSRLRASADGNFRSINQEALARLERSFEIEDAIATRTHQKWIDEALAGKFAPASVDRIRSICRRARGDTK